MDKPVLKIGVKINRTNGSLRITLPKEIVRAFDLKEGDIVDFWINEKGIICVSKFNSEGGEN